MRPLAILVAAAASVPCSGCCNLARYLCGPDRSVWVSERFDTPAHALATFREAIRRADYAVVHRSLSEDFKKQTGLVGEIEARIFWERLQEEVPGVHVLGYAESTPIRLEGDGYAEAVLWVAGRALRVGMVRQPYWEVRWVYDDDPGDLEERGRFRQSIRGLADVSYDDDGFRSELTIRLAVPDVELDLDRVQRAGIGFEWKVDRLEQTTPPKDG